MSLHVWSCRCGRRWFQFRSGRPQWDFRSPLTEYCPGCWAEYATARADWTEL